MIKPAPEVEDPKKYSPPPLEYVAPMTPEGVPCGKPLKKNVIKINHPDCSSSHCKIYADGIVDTSTNGTFVIYRERSGFVPINQNSSIMLSDYEFKLTQ